MNPRRVDAGPPELENGAADSFRDLAGRPDVPRESTRVVALPYRKHQNIGLRPPGKFRRRGGHRVGLGVSLHRQQDPSSCRCPKGL